MNETTTSQSTVLYDHHRRQGAKMVPFAGWNMPIQYPAGIIEEHKMVRERAGLFDVSHMGEIVVRGENAEAFLNFLTPSPVRRLRDGQAQYSFLCDEAGGVIDDIIIYRCHRDHFFICVNAANVETDWRWIQAQAKPFAVTVSNVSDEYALLALQGPLARSLLVESVLPGLGLGDVRRFHFADVVWQDHPLRVARTGYTGEDGFEIFVPPAAAAALWELILDKGYVHGIGPAGLGARDSLRLEAALPLYGHELDLAHSPVESELSRFVDWDKEAYLGSARLLRDRAEGGRERLIAIIMEESGIPRGDYVVGCGDVVMGRVTSGTFGPTVGKGIALAFVLPQYAEIGLDIWVEIRKKRVRARVCSKPFYKARS